MKAITLWQPWASLILYGFKRFETRGWEPPRSFIGQRIAIHAARRPFNPARDVDAATCQDMNRALARHGLVWSDLPRGAIVCTAVLANAVQAGRDEEAPDRFGDYSEGRWVWHLVDILPVDPPVAFQGRQGWFDVPDKLLAGAPAEVRP